MCFNPIFLYRGYIYSILSPRDLEIEPKTVTTMILNLNKMMIKQIHHDHKPNKQEHGNAHKKSVREFEQQGLRLAC